MLDASTSAEGGGDTTPTGAPLCGKYGGADGVKSLALDIVSAAQNDCRISPTVSNAERQRGKNFSECFQAFVASGFQCPGISFSLGQTTDSEGDECNSQMPGVRFSDRDFNTFLGIVKTRLEAKGLTEDEIRSIAPVFEGARLKLVVDPSKSKHRQCAPDCSEGGDACEKPIVDAGNDVNEPPVDAGDDAATDPDAGDEPDAGN